MASAADQTSAAVGVGTADLNHDAAGWCAADLFMRVVAGDALHLVIPQQRLVDGLAREAGTGPRRRNGRGCAGLRDWITDLVGDRIVELAVHRG